MPKVKKSKQCTEYVPYVKGFRPATSKQKSDALGTLGAPSLEYDCSSKFFKPVPKCSSENDWLAQYKEEGQTYQDFLYENPWLSRRKLKNMKQAFNTEGSTLPEKYPNGKIYVMPLGDFNSSSSPEFIDLIHYAELFFCVPIRQLPAVNLELKENETYWVCDNVNENVVQQRKIRLGCRYDKNSGRRQIKVPDVLLTLRAYIPDDALCVIALTMQDLYETKPDLFVAGMASGNHRVAVFSLLRYDPSLNFSSEFWYKMRWTKNYSNEERKSLILQRSIKLLVHEVSHLLGLGHCIYYSCCMNGSGHLAEDFRQPMFLCPIDLRKLQTLCGFNIIDRYQGLRTFFLKHGLTEEANWIDKRIEHIQEN